MGQVPRLPAFIFLEAIFGIVSTSLLQMTLIKAMALAIALHQNFDSWQIDIKLLFAGSVIATLLPFPTHYLTSSEDLAKSPRKKVWLGLAGILSIDC
jgi:hypothetical protein